MKFQQTLNIAVLLGVILFGGCATVPNTPVPDTIENTDTLDSLSGPEAQLADNKKDIKKKVTVRKAQFRKTIAVARFENRTTAAGQINLGSGMADQLTNALIQSDNFVVLERPSISDVLYEQDFSQSGRTEASNTAQSGRVVPAQILIRGSITEFQLHESGVDTGVSYKGFTVGGESSVAHLALILRIIDTSTGLILDSMRLEGKAEGKGYKFGVAYMGFGVEGEKFDNTALSKAVQQVIDRGVKKIAENLNQVPFQGKVILVEGDSFYTNIGSRNNVYGGDLFDVYLPGDDLVDPDTGENLGTLKKKIGTAVISTPKKKFSKAFPANGEVLQKGYILIQRNPIALSTAGKNPERP
jgi:curli biogenesis system outer membrane secretion channel CsgG